MSSEVEIQVDNAEENKEVKPPTKCGGIPHPISVFFHFAFKIGALFSYIFLSLFVDYFSLVFILVILFLAADLWTVKNVTGRLLVGLRFWNEIRDDGTNEWIYESLEDKRKISTTEVLIFWVGLLGFPFIWILLGIISIFEISPTSVFLVIIAFILSLPNIYGYLKCAKGLFQYVCIICTQ